MYTRNKPSKTTLNVNESYEGKTIEQKIRRISNNKEPITDGAPIIYTARKDGVVPEYDIRSDRFEMAIDEMDKKVKNRILKKQDRDKTIGEQAKEGMKKEGGGETSSVPTTDPK